MRLNWVGADRCGGAGEPAPEGRGLGRARQSRAVTLPVRRLAPLALFLPNGLSQGEGEAQEEGEDEGGTG